MAEEFDESEVIFSHNNFSDLRHREEENSPFDFRRQSSGEKRRRSKTSGLSSSAPVNIPVTESLFRRYVAAAEAAEEYSDEEYSDGGGEMVPPHVIVGRRIQGQMAFSVCTGNGRTLKGRDLSRVRNSVLRLTGFLEA